MRESEAPTTTAAVADSNEQIALEIEADATLNYASIQNAIPVVRSLRIANRTESVLDHLTVLVSCNPRFAEGVKLRFDRLGAGESRLVSPIDLKPDHTYLSELTESTSADLRMWVLSGTEEVAYTSQPVQILAYDQWAGTRALPELLAAFSMPNNPAVDVLIGKASQLLRQSNPELSMCGYQAKSRDVVWKQVSAIYSTIAAEGLQYAEPPASL